MTSDMHHSPSGIADPEANRETAPPEAQGAAESAPPSDPAAQLGAELDAAKVEIGQWRDRFLRKAAELENFRKRTEKERAETVSSAKSAVLVELLPVVDGFERALASLATTENPDESLARYREGVALLHKQLLDTLQRLGVVPLETVGRPFDPHRHDALARVESAEHGENTVVHELRKGYLFNDRLLRPAQVAVSMRPKAEIRSQF